MARCLNCIHFDVCDTDKRGCEESWGDCSDFLNDNDVVPRSEVESIFEEIEKVIGEKYENYAFDNLNIEGVEQDAIIAFADTMKIHFAELKKKYTEDQSGGNS